MLISLNPTAHGKRKKGGEKTLRILALLLPGVVERITVVDRGTRDNGDSEARWVRVQRVSISSLDRSAL
jgi:hypothetical protein